ncbi:hypothetical protein F5050DRAFT_1230702 [Lentinula boryana]|uniref:Uncharacterized protein n=1 Tax=Lentinula boryana TaxID=40481 RepID=A0ABQ8PXX3_9AGAR|nr:hypothetical protein F5050DRAFT_1230702 [Lentinula boryana]
MRLLPSITSYYILSVYLLSAALLSIVVVASPIPISSQENSDVRLKLAWRIPGQKQFQCSRSGRGLQEFTAKDRFSLFITGHAFAAGLEPQVVSQDSTNARHIQILPIAVPRTSSGKIDLKDFSAKPLIAHFVFEEFFWEHYNVIRNVDELRTRTNAMLKEKAETYKNVLLPGDPNLRHPIDIQDDLDWINTVFLYFTLINQPGGNVPVLDAKQLGGWVAMFTKMTDLRGLHWKPLKPKALQ